MSAKSYEEGESGPEEDAGALHLAAELGAYGDWKVLGHPTYRQK